MLAITSLGIAYGASMQQEEYFDTNQPYPESFQRSFSIKNGIAGSLIIAYLISSVIIFPALYHYIYATCNNESTKKWYISGLKNSWYKPTLIMTILFTIGFPVISPIAFFAIVFLGAQTIEISSSILFLVYITIVFLLTTLPLIPYIAESRLKLGFKHLFTCFLVSVHKRIATTVVVLIPLVIIGVLDSFYKQKVKAVGLIKYLPFADESIASIAVSIIICLVLVTYTIFSISFLYTYSMHLYLNTRNKISQQKEHAPS